MTNEEPLDPRIEEGVQMGVWPLMTPLREFVGVELDNSRCGLLCEFRPGVVAEGQQPASSIDLKQQESKHTFLLRYPDTIVRVDTSVSVSIIPRQVSREELREAAIIEARRQEHLYPPLEDNTPEPSDLLSQIERVLAEQLRASGAQVDYDEEPIE